MPGAGAALRRRGWEGRGRVSAHGSSEFGVGGEYRSGEASVCAGEAQAALEHEVEEERVEAVNLSEGLAVVGVEVAGANERARAYERVDRGQGVVAPVDQARVQVFARGQ